VEVQRRQDTLDVGFGASALRVMELFYYAAMCVMMTAYGVARTVVGGAARAAAGAMLGGLVEDPRATLEDLRDRVAGFRDDAEQLRTACEPLLLAYNTVTVTMPTEMRGDAVLRHAVVDGLLERATRTAHMMDIIRLLSLTDDYVDLARG
jgi:hypothetical protein